MTTVRQILDAKPNRTIHAITPDRSTYEALQLMAEKDVGAVAVMQGGRLLGLMTEREYARKIVLVGKASRNTPVGELMLTKLWRVAPSQTLEDCMALMTEKHIRYLPVMDGEHFLGLISIGDVVKSMIADYRSNIDHLQRLVTGAEYGL